MLIEEICTLDNLAIAFRYLIKTPRFERTIETGAASFGWSPYRGIYSCILDERKKKLKDAAR